MPLHCTALLALRLSFRQLSKAESKQCIYKVEQSMCTLCAAPAQQSRCQARSASGRSAVGIFILFYLFIFYLFIYLYFFSLPQRHPTLLSYTPPPPGPPASDAWSKIPKKPGAKKKAKGAKLGPDMLGFTTKLDLNVLAEDDDE